jgi:DNA-binding NtrC family response regulator
MSLKRILFVTPTADLRRLYRRLLERFGYEATCAASTTEALKELESTGESYMVVITTLELDDGDAFDLLRAVKERFSVPIIAMGMKLAGTRMYEWAMSAGFADALPFPCDLTVLQSVLHRLSPAHA